MRKDYNMQFKRGGRVKHNKQPATSQAIKSKEFQTYNEMRDHFEKQKKSEQRKKDMEKDKQKLYEKKYICFSSGGAPIAIKITNGQSCI